MTNHPCCRIMRAPLETFAFGTMPYDPDGLRNPFVKVGDVVKLHSRRGAFIVEEVQEAYFVVSQKHRSWFSITELKMKCDWNDFRNWSAKTR